MMTDDQAHAEFVAFAIGRLNRDISTPTGATTMTSKLERIAAIASEPDERVGLPAPFEMHAGLRESALELALANGGDYREFARFLIEGI